MPIRCDRLKETCIFEVIIILNFFGGYEYINWSTRAFRPEARLHWFSSSLFQLLLMYVLPWTLATKQQLLAREFLLWVPPACHLGNWSFRIANARYIWTTTPCVAPSSMGVTLSSSPSYSLSLSLCSPFSEISRQLRRQRPMGVSCRFAAEWKRSLPKHYEETNH